MSSRAIFSTSDSTEAKTTLAHPFVQTDHNQPSLLPVVPTAGKVIDTQPSAQPEQRSNQTTNGIDVGIRGIHVAKFTGDVRAAGTQLIGGADGTEFDPNGMVSEI